jgi:signal transduction histidine kinase
MNGSNADGSADEIYRALRLTAASDPRAAREQLLRMLNADSPHIDRIFELMKPPSEGRLRQLVANMARAAREDNPFRDRLIPHLLNWQRFESDEFAKPAINAALQGMDLSAYADVGVHGRATGANDNATGNSLVSDEAVAIYRWVAGRLCHRVRNELELPTAYIADAIHRATAIADNGTRAGITRSLVEAQEAFQKVARVVEFNIADEHFRWRRVELISWLRRMTDRYRSTHAAIRLEFTGDQCVPTPSIMANDLLLEVIFWNLWRNAMQEADGECVVNGEITMRDDRVYLLLSDNGPGFQASQAAEAFSVRISMHGEDRGRGLLEVADAVQRLQGSARIVHVGSQYRIELSFPIADTPR